MQHENETHFMKDSSSHCEYHMAECNCARGMISQRSTGIGKFLCMKFAGLQSCLSLVQWWHGKDWSLHLHVLWSGKNEDGRERWYVSECQSSQKPKALHGLHSCECKTYPPQHVIHSQCRKLGNVQLAYSFIHILLLWRVVFEIPSSIWYCVHFSVCVMSVWWAKPLTRRTLCLA